MGLPDTEKSLLSAYGPIAGGILVFACFTVIIVVNVLSSKKKKSIGKIKSTRDPTTKPKSGSNKKSPATSKQKSTAKSEKKSNAKKKKSIGKAKATARNSTRKPKSGADKTSPASFEEKSTAKSGKKSKAQVRALRQEYFLKEWKAGKHKSDNSPESHERIIKRITFFMAADFIYEYLEIVEEWEDQYRDLKSRTMWYNRLLACHDKSLPRASEFPLLCGRILVARDPTMEFKVCEMERIYQRIFANNVILDVQMTKLNMETMAQIEGYQATKYGANDSKLQNELSKVYEAQIKAGIVKEMGEELTSARTQSETEAGVEESKEQKSRFLCFPLEYFSKYKPGALVLLSREPLYTKADAKSAFCEEIKPLRARELRRFEAPDRKTFQETRHFKHFMPTRRGYMQCGLLNMPEVIHAAVKRVFEYPNETILVRHADFKSAYAIGTALNTYEMLLSMHEEDQRMLKPRDVLQMLISKGEPMLFDNPKYVADFMAMLLGLLSVKSPNHKKHIDDFMERLNAALESREQEIHQRHRRLGEKAEAVHPARN